MNTTLGTDPELFVWGRRQNRMVSALKVLGVDKHKPILLDRGVKVYADNALAEASMPPEESVDGIVSRTGDAIRQLKSKIGREYDLVAAAAHVFDKREMGSKKLWEIGCNPNFNAYTRQQNIPQQFNDTMRTGSFHIHIGDDSLRGEIGKNPNKETIIKVLDIYLGCASVIFDKDDTALRRRKYYGKAGEFRPTPYGVEYRVLGNWSLRSQETTKLCFDLALYALSHIHDGTGQAVCEAVGENDPQEAINENNPLVASDVLLKAATPDHFLDRIFKVYKNKEMNWL
jgi:hypothetical protein